MTNRIFAYACQILATLLFSSAALAAIELETPRPVPPAAGPIEEIEIIGQRSLISLRIEMNRAEDDMYDLFNTLNSSDDMNMTCVERAVINTRIKRRFCERAYIEKARLENVQEFMLLGMPLKSDLQLWAENEENHKKFDAELLSVSKQYPEMAAAVVKAVTIRQRYGEERRKRYQGSFLGRLLTGQLNTESGSR